MQALTLVIPVEDGKLDPTVGQAEAMRNYLHTRDGKAVAVKLSRPTNTRTLAQNAYMWSVVLPTIANHVGYSSEEVHALLKDQFLPRKFVKIGNREVTINKTTTDLTTTEFEQYLEQVRAWASTELGLFIPEPDTKGQRT